MGKDAVNYLIGVLVGAGVTGVTAFGIHQIFKERNVKEGMQCGMKATMDYIADATAYTSHGAYTSDEVRMGLDKTIGEYNKDHPGVIWRKAEDNYNRLQKTGSIWESN